MLIKDLNEAAAIAFQQEQGGSAAECLKKAEQLLEATLSSFESQLLASSGSNIDRNLIIITLYNLAVYYQK